MSYLLLQRLMFVHPWKERAQWQNLSGPLCWLPPSFLLSLPLLLEEIWVRSGRWFQTGFQHRRWTPWHQLLERWAGWWRRQPEVVPLLSGCRCDTPDIWAMFIIQTIIFLFPIQTWSSEAVNTLASGAGPYPQCSAVTASEWSEKVNLWQNEQSCFKADLESTWALAGQPGGQEDFFAQDKSPRARLAPGREMKGLEI